MQLVQLLLAGVLERHLKALDRHPLKLCLCKSLLQFLFHLLLHLQPHLRDLFRDEVVGRCLVLSDYFGPEFLSLLNLCHRDLVLRLDKL